MDDFEVFVFLDFGLVMEDEEVDGLKEDVEWEEDEGGDEEIILECWFIFNI